MCFQVYRPALGSPSLNTQLETLIAEFQLAFEGNAENQRAQAIRVGPPTARRVLGEGIRGWNRSRTAFQAWRARGMVQWRAQASECGRRSLFSDLPRRQFSEVEGRAPAKSYSGRYTRPARSSLVRERGQIQPRVPEADDLRALEAIRQAIGSGVSRQWRTRGRKGAHLEL